MNYLLKATGVLVLVAIGLRLAAWLVTPVMAVLLGLFIALTVMSAVFLPSFWSKHSS